jgi:hypothetical protein
LPAYAEQVGSISGKIVDSSSGKPVSGVAARVVGGPAATTNKDGFFVLLGLMPGLAKVVVQAPAGYRVEPVCRYQVYPGTRVELTYRLQPGAGGKTAASCPASRALPTTDTTLLH